MLALDLRQAVTHPAQELVVGRKHVPAEVELDPETSRYTYVYAVALHSGGWLPDDTDLALLLDLDLLLQRVDRHGNAGIDTAVFDCALDWLETNDDPVCINVSPQTVCDPVLTARYYQALKGRLVPDHIASLVMFLASDDAAMCTAQEFKVDAGWS